MLQNAYFLAKIGADTAENEQHFAEILPTDALWRPPPHHSEPQVEEAGEELDGLIHARQLGYELKLGKAEKKESDLVRQALRNML